MWVTSLGLAGEAGIFASRPFYPMFSGVPNGPLRLSPPQVHAAVHNSGYIKSVWKSNMHIKSLYFWQKRWFTTSSYLPCQKVDA